MGGMVESGLARVADKYASCPNDVAVRGSLVLTKAKASDNALLIVSHQRRTNNHRCFDRTKRLVECQPCNMIEKEVAHVRRCELIADDNDDVRYFDRKKRMYGRLKNLLRKHLGELAHADIGL